MHALSLRNTVLEYTDVYDLYRLVMYIGDVYGLVFAKEYSIMPSRSSLNVA